MTIILIRIYYPNYQLSFISIVLDILKYLTSIIYQYGVRHFKMSY